LLIAYGVCFDTNLAWQYINDNAVFVVGALLFAAFTHLRTIKVTNSCPEHIDDYLYEPHIYELTEEE